jgi:capsular polysaccharide biosynthesis protein
MANQNEEMKDNKNNPKRIFGFFLKSKWRFIGAFLIVLVCGLIFTFLKTPLYTSSFQVQVRDNFYDDYIYKYYTEEAGKLGIFSTNINEKEYEIRNYSNLFLDLGDDKIIQGLINEFTYIQSINGIRNKIDIIVDGPSRTLKVAVRDNNSQNSYDIANYLLQVYLDKKNIEFSDAYTNMLAKVDSGLNELQKDIDAISVEAEQYVIDLNKQIYNDEEQGTNFKGTDFVSPELQSRLNFDYYLYNKLHEIKYNLISNKEYLTNRIEVLKNPAKSDEPSNKNYFNYLAITVFLAIFIGLVTLFIVNFIKNDKS